MKTTAIEYALGCIKTREIQIENINKYINWYNENLREIEPRLTEIKEALKKGGFSNIEVKLEVGNRLSYKLLESEEPIEIEGQLFSIEIEANCTGYVNSSCNSKSWYNKIEPVLLKKREKIQNLLPKGFEVDPFCPFDWEVNTAGTIKKFFLKIYKK